MPPPGRPEHSRLTVRTLCLDVAPAFTQLPVDTTVTDGMTAVLRCEVSGAPDRPSCGAEVGGSHLPQEANPAGQGYLCYSHSPVHSVTRKILGSQMGETPSELTVRRGGPFPYHERAALSSSGASVSALGQAAP